MYNKSKINKEKLLDLVSNQVKSKDSSKTLMINVITNAKNDYLAFDENKGLVLHLRAKPIKGQANKEIIAFFKKEYLLKVDILKGLQSHKKILRLC